MKRSDEMNFVCQSESSLPSIDDSGLACLTTLVLVLLTRATKPLLCSRLDTPPLLPPPPLPPIKVASGAKEIVLFLPLFARLSMPSMPLSLSFLDGELALPKWSSCSMKWIVLLRYLLVLSTSVSSLIGEHRLLVRLLSVWVSSRSTLIILTTGLGVVRLGGRTKVADGFEVGETTDGVEGDRFRSAGISRFTR